MSVLVFGENGQLARALARSLTARGQDFVCYGRDDIDLIASPKNAAAIIQREKPRAVINACAFTDVDGAETHRTKANILNHTVPEIMAKTCKAAGIAFIHISTDYVFDGQKSGPYRPGDKRNPLNAYGHSKAAGERAVMEAGGQSLILRTSWLYDGTGQNFLTTMLRLGRSSKVSLVTNQFGRPTYAGHLAEACLRTLDRVPKTPKIYHVTNSGTAISWAEYAKTIFTRAKLNPDISLLTAKHFTRSAKRPTNSVLDISDFERDFSYPLEAWEVGLDLALQEVYP